MTSILKTLIKKPVVLALIALLGVKICLLLALGPVFTPDSVGYVGIANTILANDSWLHDVGIKSTAIPALAFRMIGYPAAIAAAMKIGGPAWPWLIVISQIAMSLVASGLIYCLAIKLGLRPAWALFAMIAAATSFQLTLDQCILTDSFHASFFIIAMYLLSRTVAAGQPFTLTEAAFAGIFLVLAFLMREAMQFLVITLLPLIGVCIFLFGRSKWINTVAGIAILFLPLFAAVEAYEQWNNYRTGIRFVTTTGQITMPQALSRAASFDARVFGGETPFDVAARRSNIKNFHWGAVVQLNELLFRQGYLAPDIARLGFSHYFMSWRNYPLAMLGVLKSYTDEKMIKSAFRPIASVCMTVEWATGTRDCPQFRYVMRAARHGFSNSGIVMPLFFVFQGAERIVSIVIFAFFLIGVPCIFIATSCHRPIDHQIAVAAAFWAMYIGWYLMYGVVHFEERYLMPVIPLSIVCGLVAIANVKKRLWHRGRGILSA